MASPRWTGYRAALAVGVAGLTVAGCARRSAAPTAADAVSFLDTVNSTMLKLGVQQNQAGWVGQTYITDDTEALNARLSQQYIDAVAGFAKAATRFDHLDLPAEGRRQIHVLKTSLVMATPAAPAESEELTTIMARLETTYGKGKWCEDRSKPESCLNIDQITKIMASSRDARRLWPDALEAVAGSREMDATAILDYFAPLSKWLDDQLVGKPVGW